MISLNYRPSEKEIDDYPKEYQDLIRKGLLKAKPYSLAEEGEALGADISMIPTVGGFAYMLYSLNKTDSIIPFIIAVSTICLPFFAFRLIGYSAGRYLERKAAKRGIIYKEDPSNPPYPFIG